MRKAILLALTILFAFCALPAFAAGPAKICIDTEFGDIIAEIYTKEAPRTATHFLKYVKEGLFTGGSFYRTVRADNQGSAAVKISVIQGGPNVWRARSAKETIMVETTKETGLKHLDGTLSLARMTLDSGNENFFVCVGDQPELDFGGKRHEDGQGFAAFGRVTEGMDIVRRIQLQKADGQGVVIPVRILSIKILSE